MNCLLFILGFPIALLALLAVFSMLWAVVAAMLAVGKIAHNEQVKLNQDGTVTTEKR